MEPFTYILPPDFSLKKLRRKMPEKSFYTLSLAKGERQEGQFLDTFAGEVCAARQLLLQIGNSLVLVDFSSGFLVRQQVSREWSLAGDLAEGPVKSLLKKASQLRAFLPIARGRIRSDRGLLIDDEGKTRARFFNLILAANGKTVGVGITHHLRGYDKAHGDLCESLTRTGAVPCDGPRQLYERLEIKQEEYRAKPLIQLDPASSAKESATRIIRSFLQVARRNEQGVIDDLDTEFLHDYRVSLRKVRSVLSLFKGVYSVELTRRLREEFSSVMRQTNRLRDLDVYLLTRQQYYGLVPEDVHGGLDLLFAHIGALRRKEQKIARKAFRQQSYLAWMEAVEQLFVDDSALSSGPQGDCESLDFACRLVIKRYHKVCRIARTIDDQTEDAVVHQLRINCKKLRYLMEFFAPLFAADQIQSLIKSLKLLQDNLGMFNDYAVQQKFLRQLLDSSMAAFGDDQLQVAESIGALTAMLHQLQAKERGLIITNLSRFDGIDTRDAFAKLFQKVTTE